MKNNLKFSVAQKINIYINGNISNKCLSFLNKIYNNFDKIIEKPIFELKIEVTDSLPKINATTQLGKDGYANKNTFIQNSGHFFIMEKNVLTIGVPSKVKRGRVPFKRITPGRHLSDEIIEPFLQVLLLECNATFVHASSVYVNGKVDVLMGWRGTGKTNAILKNIDSKEIWSDDLSIIDSEGYVYPYLRPIRLYSYNLPLINKKYIAKNNLNIKKYITPSWRPVHYLQLQNKSSVEKGRLNSLTYLNNPESSNLAKDSEEIMKFEQLFFENIRLMLQHLKILKVNNSIEKIINDALLTIDK